MKRNDRIMWQQLSKRGSGHWEGGGGGEGGEGGGAVLSVQIWTDVIGRISSPFGPSHITAVDMSTVVTNLARSGPFTYAVKAQRDHRRSLQLLNTSSSTPFAGGRGSVKTQIVIRSVFTSRCFFKRSHSDL